MLPPDDGYRALLLWSTRPEQGLRDVTGTLTLTAIVDRDAKRRACVSYALPAALEV
jgi:hypothetical protein